MSVGEMPDMNDTERIEKIAGRIAADKATVNISFTVQGDASDSLVRMLRHIQKLGDTGHSFAIVVDPDNSEYRETFGFDGDGSDRIDEILVDETPLPEK
jgi:hypothetical protein